MDQQQQPSSPPRYLRESERRIMEADLQRLSETERNAASVGNSAGVDMRKLSQVKRNISECLELQTPPDVNGAERDRISKRIEADEAAMMADIPSSEEMRRNPPGAVERHMAFERKHGKRIQRWKHDIRVLNKGNPDVDFLTNIERLRPLKRDVNMEGSAIPKTRSYFEMTESGHEKAMVWEDVFDGSPARLQEKHEAEMAELRAERDRVAAELEAEKRRSQQNGNMHQKNRNQR